MVGIESPIEIMNNSFNNTFISPEVVLSIQGLTAKIHILTAIVAGLYIYFLIMRWWTIKKTEKTMKDMQKDIKELKVLLTKPKRKKK